MNVGKSNLIYRLMEDKFKGVTKNTIVTEYCRKYIQIGEFKVEANIWDTTG